MNDLTAEPIIRDRDVVHTQKASQGVLILMAWLGALILSRLAQIILNELEIISPSDWSLW